jgi:hypothetical protein
LIFELKRQHHPLLLIQGLLSVSTEMKEYTHVYNRLGLCCSISPVMGISPPKWQTSSSHPMGTPERVLSMTAGSSLAFRNYCGSSAISFLILSRDSTTWDPWRSFLSSTRRKLSGNASFAPSCCSTCPCRDYHSSTFLSLESVERG